MDLRSRTAKPLDNIAESSRKLPLEKRNSLGFGGPMKLNDPETREPFHLDNLIRSDVPKSPGEFKKFLMELFQVPEEKRINSLRKLVSNDMFSNFRATLRVEFGNALFNVRQYSEAVKQYRMAVDEIPLDSVRQRGYVFLNIGHALMKLKEYESALSSYANSHTSDACLNALICAVLCGSAERAQLEFRRVIRTRQIRKVELGMSILAQLDVPVFDILRQENMHDLMALYEADSSLNKFRTTGNVTLDTIVSSVGSLRNFGSNLTYLTKSCENHDMNPYDAYSIVNYTTSTPNLSVEDRLVHYGHALALSPDCWEARLNIASLLGSSDWLRSITGPASWIAKYRLARHLETEGRYSEAASVYVELSSGTFYNDVHLLEHIASLYEKKLKDPVRAAQYRMDAKLIDPTRLYISLLIVLISLA